MQCLKLEHELETATQTEPFQAALFSNRNIRTPVSTYGATKPRDRQQDTVQFVYLHLEQPF